MNEKKYIFCTGSEYHRLFMKAWSRVILKDYKDYLKQLKKRLKIENNQQ